MCSVSSVWCVEENVSLATFRQHQAQFKVRTLLVVPALLHVFVLFTALYTYQR